jgi:hypothetical protein
MHYKNTWLQLVVRNHKINSTAVFTPRKEAASSGSIKLCSRRLLKKKIYPGELKKSDSRLEDHQAGSLPYLVEEEEALIGLARLLLTYVLSMSITSRFVCGV